MAANLMGDPPRWKPAEPANVPAFIWLSGFVGAGLIFAGITDGCGMGLLLGKAPWNQKT